MQNYIENTDLELIRRIVSNIDIIKRYEVCIKAVRCGFFAKKKVADDYLNKLLQNDNELNMPDVHNFVEKSRKAASLDELSGILEEYTSEFSAALVEVLRVIDFGEAQKVAYPGKLYNEIPMGMSAGFAIEFNRLINNQYPSYEYRCYVLFFYLNNTARLYFPDENTAYEFAQNVMVPCSVMKLIGDEGKEKELFGFSC